MPGKVEIMRKVQEHLNELEVAKDESDEVWTKEVKTKLCKIGRRLGYSAYAKKNEVDSRYRDGGEWLYDVTWLEYKCNGDPRRRFVLSTAPLVAECEWGNLGDIYDDFEKLLLARADVRLMIFDCNRAGGSSKEIAQRLAGRVKAFKARLAEDAWLLVSWERKVASTNPNDWWRFRYFTIEESGLRELT